MFVEQIIIIGYVKDIRKHGFVIYLTNTHINTVIGYVIVEHVNLHAALARIMHTHSSVIIKCKYLRTRERVV